MRAPVDYRMVWAAAFSAEYLRLADAGMRGPAAAAEAAFKADSAERDLRAHDAKPVPGGRWCGDVAHAADGSPPDDCERCDVEHILSAEAALKAAGVSPPYAAHMDPEAAASFRRRWHGRPEVLAQDVAGVYALLPGEIVVARVSNTYIITTEETSDTVDPIVNVWRK